MSSSQVPKIKLPQFSGNFKDWPEFRDHFKAIILNDVQFDAFQKLYYLKSCLDGEAAKLLKNLAVTADNFDIAWKMMNDRYENKRRLLYLYLNQLFSLKPVSNDRSPIDLRRLLDSAQEAVDALTNLGRPVSDDIIVYIIVERLDRGTREAWNFSLGEEEYPTYEKLRKFMTAKIRSYEASVVPNKPIRSTPISSRGSNTSASRAQTHHAIAKTQVNCVLCAGSHPLYKCKVLQSHSVAKRWEVIKKHATCSNCLSIHHEDASCKSERTCVHCGSRHHSLLHRPSDKTKTPASGSAPIVASTSHTDSPNEDISFVQAHLSTPRIQSHVILATAWVLITAPSQRVAKVRALLDQGSTHTFITREVANALRTPTYATSVVVSGVGQNGSKMVGRAVPITVSAVKHSAVKLMTDALILDKLTDYTPKFRFPLSHWPHLDGLELADGCPTDATPVHMIIGADMYAYALRDGLVRGKRDEPVAMNTVFGWVLSGMSDTEPPDVSTVHAHHAQSYENLNLLLPRFWEIEEISPLRPLSEEDERCEQHFRETHSRSLEGRYMMRILFKDAPPLKIGDTFQRASKCLKSLERRLSARPQERSEYETFLTEYEALGHMRVALPLTDTTAVYLPHHPVIKATSTTTKTRVVFNASSVSSNGCSLNDVQLVGPKLQSDLPMLHMQWRTHRYVYAADIEKMYRQILVDERDIDTQRILWRKSPNDAVLEYQLLTVTYGTASAPYLALRVLRQLAEDEGSAFPHGKDVLLGNMFVDDALFGTDTVGEARRIRDETNALLARGHFTLRKWASNDPSLLADIEPQNHGLSCDKSLQSDESIKVLGLAWHVASDSYNFTVNRADVPIVTKRLVLSHIARIFDPLGWIAPVVIAAKILMQRLWKCAVDWDSPLPADIVVLWTEFYDALPALSSLSIPRWLGTSPSVKTELHGFSDASCKAYACVIYARIETSDGRVDTVLVSAKTRVAPLKHQTTPRLELCGAVLLARLITQVRSALAFSHWPVHCWTDATIVLAWLRGQSSQWRTFVASRVAELHSSLPDVPWRHVPGKENPADLASRGVSACDIGGSDLWWYGPTWLRLPPSEWPTHEPDLADDAPLELKSPVHHASIAQEDAEVLFRRVSSWPRLCRIILICLRWSKSWTTSNRLSSWSYTKELALVSVRIFSLTQAQFFRRELELLQDNPASAVCRRLKIGQTLPKRSPLKRLNPFMDDDSLLRVSGRLSLSQLPFTSKFPVILPSGHIAQLLARHAHIRCLHGGVTLTLSTLREQVWVLQARKIVKAVVHHCVVCARHSLRSLLS